MRGRVVAVTVASLMACHESRPPQVQPVGQCASPPSSPGAHLEWWTWGDQAFRAGATGGRPIFVYTTAWWCTLCEQFERQTLADSAIVALLDTLVVPVRVDRDICPEVDLRLQRALAVMTGLDGWPAALLLTPSGDPFYATTYLPPSDPVKGLGLREALTQAVGTYDRGKGRVERMAAWVRALTQGSEGETTGIVTWDTFDALFDSVWADTAASAEAVALIYEVIADYGDASALPTADRKLEAVLRERASHGTPFPTLLQALALRHVIAPSPESSRELRKEAVGAARALRDGWERATTDQAAHLGAGIVEVGMALDAGRVMAVGVRLIDSIIAVTYEPGLGVRRGVPSWLGDRRYWLDDHLALVTAALAAERATKHRWYLEVAVDIMETVQRRFADPAGGGYFDVSEDADLSVFADQRVKPMFDGIVPGANGQAARLAVMLHERTGDRGWLRVAARTVEVFATLPPAGVRMATYTRAVRAVLRADLEPGNGVSR